MSGYNLPRSLRRLMFLADVSQAQLAEHLDVTRQSVHNYIMGNNEPSLQKLVQIADHLNVSMDDLIGREWPPARK